MAEVVKFPKPGRVEWLGWQLYPDGSCVDLWNLHLPGDPGGYTLKGAELIRRGYSLPDPPVPAPGPRRNPATPAALLRAGDYIGQLKGQASRAFALAYFLHLKDAQPAAPDHRAFHVDSLGAQEIRRKLTEILGAAFPNPRGKGGRRVFCSEGCKAGYRSDRQHGIMYPPVSDDGGKTLHGWHEWHVKHGRCPYCRAEVKRNPAGAPESWIEPAREDERADGPYRLCFPSGERFALSHLDAFRAMKDQGIPYLPPGVSGPAGGPGARHGKYWSRKNPPPRYRWGSAPMGWNLVHPKEAHLIEAVMGHEYSRDYRLDVVKRRSDREYDLELTGTHKWHRQGFSGWLPLMAIYNLTRWTSPAMAAETDYPDMVKDGDWSGVRDSETDTIWRLFDRHVLPRKRSNPSRATQGNPPRRGRVIYPEGVIKGTWYGKHRNGEHYFHKFGRGKKWVRGLPDGTLQIGAHKGRLWGWH